MAILSTGRGFWMPKRHPLVLQRYRQDRLAHPRVFLYGRWIDSPRQSAWYGDRGAVYRYSGTINEPIPWLPELKDLGERLNDFCKSEFNSVLAKNHYRSGSDSMGWHSDDEKELGPEPVIASISLGGARRFLLRHRRRKELQTHEITLESGSLLLMRGSKASAPGVTASQDPQNRCTQNQSHLSSHHADKGQYQSG